MTLALPESRDAIARIQSERKVLAFERAKRTAWYAGKLDHIDPAKLDDPKEWTKIPIIDKEILRRWKHDEFMAQINIAGPKEISEYWRSGGSTGRAVFYPRTFDDVTYGLLSWGRSFPCIGIEAGDLCHISFPIGIHPAGQIWARSAHDFGVGMSWVGAGTAVPSAGQLELIATLKPTVLIAMPSFAIHLANLADVEGIDLTKSSVRTIVTSAETLSEAKREKLTRMWGAEVFDVFGMSEAGLMGAEGAAHDGIHIWTDLFYIEVVDPETGRQMPEGEIGTFCVTPLWTGHATPFLRWNSGDIVSYHDRGESPGKFAELYPMIRHARRTTGFFKIRGVNVNHSEFEDFMFRNPDVNDFQGVLVTDQSGMETLKLRIEVKRGTDPKHAAEMVAGEVKSVFEVTPDVEVLAAGTLAKVFEASIKAPRFVDERE
ncbi:MAG TPA: AMP-binding protein [Alphaproteobacteria bacterium]|nr:AMP-binding protein [Alphaproteobacteria bacterium]